MQIYDRLDAVHISAIDREHAKAHMRSAEATIDFAFAALAKTGAVSAAIGRRIGDLVRRIQVSIRPAAQ